MFTNSRRRELTDEEIREIFFNSDDEGDYNTESSGSDSDSEERLPPNLVSLERNPELGEGDDDVEENPEEGPSVVPCSRPEGPVPVEEVRSSDWRTAVDFTPPGPGIEFDSSISGVQNPPETPTAVNCFRMFLSVETVGEIVEETNRYANTRDPLNKIRNVFNALTSAFKRSFIPYKDLCVDESLMLWKGRLGFRQYIPSKRHRFGIKFFVLCDVHLLHQGTGACGTVRLNRRGMPTFPKKMKRGEVTFRENGTQLAVKWQDKRDVNLLTTVHPSSMAQSGRLDHFTGEPKVKPACVLDYNKKMGAMDRADMITSFVDCARKKERMPYKDFRLKLVKELIQEHPLPRRSTGGRPCVNTPLRLTGRHFPSFVPPTEAQGTEHKAALQSLPLHHPMQKGEKTNALHVFLM
ncbi:hypothetical protein SKAU_G00414880 [Synaphobranchus kaupii]|uniref:PiggyBac transposable element-derived protein domain-containing protein n=1 Tax=Synaphobranchus kaupii TaxID=118154 RepID=A0A9Q1IAL2_SYNKA|nr:hypothetical protein SKAU_G00414880 [Synaphobranchus kaupii]